MKILRVILSLVIVFCITFTLFYGKTKINASAPFIEKPEYKGVISMWQIDSFEGGVGSRKQFLLEMARTYEKNNQGVLVMVTDYTAEGAEEKFSQGIFPDIVSFGLGLDVRNTCVLGGIDTVKGGQVGDSTYATAWCRGGYVLIANPKLANDFSALSNGVIVSQSEYTEPLLALHVEGYTVQKYIVCQPMDAYVKFTNGESPYLLGTQRDIHRLERRGMEVITKPLEKYNDLYQYVAVTSSMQTKKYYAIDFVRFLRSETVQSKLGKIGMISPFISVENKNPTLAQMQEIKNKYTLSAFSSKQLLKELQLLSRQAISGDKDSANKIQNVLI